MSQSVLVTLGLGWMDRLVDYMSIAVTDESGFAAIYDFCPVSTLVELITPWFSAVWEVDL